MRTLVLVLIGVAGCGGAMDEDDQFRVFRRSCPDSSWNDGLSVDPDVTQAGGTETLDFQWRVFEAAEPPYVLTVEAPLADATVLWTLDLAREDTEFPDVAVLRASGINPFGSVFANAVLVVSARAARPTGCAQGPTASESLRLVP